MKHFLDNSFTVISGPCSLESYDHIDQYFERFDQMKYLRGGLFKLRTQAKSFQGLRSEGTDIIRKLKKNHAFHFVSEVVSIESFEALKNTTDIFQIGTRNMYNYELLKYISANTEKPIILKRAFSATLDEWLSAAKYIENSEVRVILCERGIRSFETKYRNTLDLNAVSYIKNHTNYKIIVDPSHGTGRREMVADLAKASMLVGADGLLIETHPSPNQALSDGAQTLDFQAFEKLIEELNKVGEIFNKKVMF